MCALFPSLWDSKFRAESRRVAIPMAGRRIGRISALALVLALAAGSPGCTTPLPNDDLVCETPESVMKQYLYRRVETDRAARLGRRIEQLSADLAEAEAALARGESGLRGEHSRADAVSSLAEARIHVERAAKRAPWRPLVVAEAHAKLNDARKQIEANHFGAALFFVYRAQRLAADLEAEAEKVGRTPGTRFVAGRRVNLRAGPSSSEPVLTILEEGMPVFPESRQQPWVLVRTAGGAVGWVHGTLLSGD